MSEDFGLMLERFRLRAGRSRNKLAIEVGVDPSYITRIVHGHRKPPRFHIVQALARTLRLNQADCSDFLVAAGYVPLSLVQLGGWSDALQAVADVLTNPYLAPEERDAFTSVVQQIARQWMANGQAPSAMPRLTNGAEVAR